MSRHQNKTRRFFGGREGITWSSTSDYGTRNRICHQAARYWFSIPPACHRQSLTCFDLELAGGGVDGLQQVVQGEVIVFVVQAFDTQRKWTETTNAVGKINHETLQITPWNTLKMAVNRSEVHKLNDSQNHEFVIRSREAFSHNDNVVCPSDEIVLAQNR